MQIHQKQNVLNKDSPEDNERRSCFSIQWILDGKRCTISLALCGESGALSFSFPPWQREKITLCCFAVGHAAPFRRLSARDLVFQELIKRACDLQSWFQSPDGQIHSEHTLSCNFPSSSCSQPQLLHSQVKPEGCF